MDKNTLEYSVDNGKTWTLVVPDEYGQMLYLEVNAGDEVLFRGGGFDNKNNDDCYIFSVEGDFDVEGNIMSMIYGDNFYNRATIDNNAFLSLFSNCTGLTSAENLVLPATTLAEFCYQDMFRWCESLTTAPALPATTLADYCYDRMFQNCSSLTTAPSLPSTTLAEGCYQSMFEGCTSLTAAPELPATTLTVGCYYYMFYGCTSLNYIKCLAADISAEYPTDDWVNDVAQSGTFVKNPNMSSWTTGASGIPTGWTVQDAS